MPSQAPAAATGASPRCRRTRALAQSQAYLLFAPSVFVEGVHLPNVGDETGMGVFQGSGYQARAALAYSPLDLVRGAITLDAAESECRSFEAAERARRVMELGTTLGELPARRAELAALQDAIARAEEILAHARTRVAEGLSTTPRLLSLETEVERLRHRAAALRHTIADLVAAGHEEVNLTTLDADVEAYEEGAMSLEAHRSTLRRLSAWTVGVRAGIVPTETVDWYGQIQIGWNLGGVAQHLVEDELLEARRAELTSARDELRGHVARLRERLRSTLPGLREELAHVDHQLEVLERQDALLARLETAEAEELRAHLTLQAIALRAQRAYFATLAQEHATAARSARRDHPEGRDDGR